MFDMSETTVFCLNVSIKPILDKFNSIQTMLSTISLPLNYMFYLYGTKVYKGFQSY